MTLHILFILLEWFVKWEAGDLTAAVLEGAASIPEFGQDSMQPSNVVPIQVFFHQPFFFTMCFRQKGTISKVASLQN